MIRAFRSFYIAILAVVVAGAWHCSGQNDSEIRMEQDEANKTHSSEGQAVMKFDTLFHDFGTIIEGEQVVCYFRYENTGNADLVIESVEATCGCTTPDWETEPLKPGSAGLLKVLFDSDGRQGMQRKRVTVMTNGTTHVHYLTLTANIKENNNY